MVVGSAPLAGNVLTFIRCALGCLVVEGYGQTECTAPISCTVQGDSDTEHVGPPVSCCCIKVKVAIFRSIILYLLFIIHFQLVDVPEMEYYALDNQGEICVKGSNVFHGYITCFPNLIFFFYIFRFLGIIKTQNERPKPLTRMAGIILVTLVCGYRMER